MMEEYSEIKQRITGYWGRRSDTFLEQRRKELHSVHAGRWQREIQKHIPKKTPLKILDVGCGSGFFSILLARQGHKVTGIDLTPEMICTARLLAEEEKVKAAFYRMDAEQLLFPEETFDVLISRNLTWTLPHPEKAYREWIRVLKRGGCLLNFDADYGKDNSEDVSHLPKNHAHHMLEQGMLKENEAIKKELFISRENRPEWDVNILKKSGLRNLKTDMEFGRRIYRKEEEFYNPAQVFMIKGYKTNPSVAIQYSKINPAKKMITG